MIGMIIGMPPGMDGAARAQLGFGGIVYDPKNHAQNLLTAARTLGQINNQIRQLENEARMLRHQAQNLMPLGTSLSPELAASLHETRRLMMAASALSYEISRLEASFDRLFPNQYAAGTGSRELDRRTREALDVARAGYRESLSAQARLMTELGGDTARLEGLMAESAAAPGGLAATQAGNELLGLATKQIMQLQSVTIVAARAEALKAAQAGALKGAAEARYRRFVGDQTAYTRD
jgi:P-type conjugative transfer protein TrbJ